MKRTSVSDGGFLIFKFTQNIIKFYKRKYIFHKGKKHMATFLQTDEVQGLATIPSTAGTIIRKDQFGIDAILENYIIQDVSITCSRTSDITQDQKGAVVSELDYDASWQGQMTIIGGSVEDPTTLDTNITCGTTDFTWNDKKWKLDSITYTGNFQSKKIYQLAFHRFANFPSQVTAST